MLKFICPFCGNEIAEENNTECCGEVGHGSWAIVADDGDVTFLDIQFNNEDERFEYWMQENYESLHNNWVEHLASLQDSIQHVTYIYKSDKCFKEWAYDVFSKRNGGTYVA